MPATPPGTTPGRRVVSLVPSITETLLSWGVEPLGVTRFCEAPGLATVGGTKNPDIGKIVALSPDLVVMDREENRRADAEQLEAAGVEVLATDVLSLDDVEPALARLAEALGVPLPAGPETAPGPLGPEPARRVWVPIWRRPWMTIGGGTYGSSLLSAAGFRNVYEDADEAYPGADPAQAADLGPDYVLAPSEPYKFGERHREELERVAPVVFVDGQDLFWWGSRTPSALRRLRALAGGLTRGQDSTGDAREEA